MKITFDPQKIYQFCFDILKGRLEFNINSVFFIN